MGLRPLFLAYVMYPKGCEMIVREMKDGEARQILQDMLDNLSSIAVEEMTTFELSLIRRVAADHPALPIHGAEWPM